MRGRKTVWCELAWIVGVSGMLVSACALGQTQIALSDEAARLREGWRSLDHGAANWSARFAYSNSEERASADGWSTGKVIYRSHVNSSGTNDSWLFAVDVLSLKDPSRVVANNVYCANPEYGFVVGRQPLDGPYLLKMFDWDLPGKQRARASAPLSAIVARSLSFSLPDELLNLSEISANPSFDVLEARDIDEQGEFREYRIRYAPTGQGAGRDPLIREGTIIVEPRHAFRIVRGNTASKAGTGSIRVAYVNPGPDWEIREVTRICEYSGVRVTELYSFEDSGPAATPNSFRLQAFGLEEIPRPEPPQSSHLWVIAVVASGLGIGSLLLLRRVARRPGETANPEQGRPSSD